MFAPESLATALHDRWAVFDSEHGQPWLNVWSAGVWRCADVSASPPHAFRWAPNPAPLLGNLSWEELSHGEQMVVLALWPAVELWRAGGPAPWS